MKCTLTLALGVILLSFLLEDAPGADQALLKPINLG